MLFMGLFVVTGAFQATGYGEQAVQWLAHVGLNLHSLPVLAVVTAVLSNLINNSAAVLLLVKMVDVTHPPMAYVLALANSFGGSLIILGSVSNIIVVEQARELGDQHFLPRLRALGRAGDLGIAGRIDWLGGFDELKEE